MEQLQAKLLYIIKNLHGAYSIITNKLVVLDWYTSIVIKIQAKVSLLNNLGWEHMAAALHRLYMLISVASFETGASDHTVESAALSISILTQLLGSNLSPSHPSFVADSLNPCPLPFPFGWQMPFSPLSLQGTSFL